MHQPPLIDSGGNELPSPIFKSRPGWGGQLKAWMDNNLYQAIFRIVLLTVAVTITGAVIRSWDMSQQVRVSPTPSPLTAYQFTVARNQSISGIARQAVAQYLVQTSIVIDGAQMLYATDALAHQAGWKPVEVGSVFSFDISTIANIVTKAQALTPTQRAAWQRLLPTN